MAIRTEDYYKILVFSRHFICLQVLDILNSKSAGIYKMENYQPLKLETQLKRTEDESNKDIIFWGVEKTDGLSPLTREGIIHLEMLNNLKRGGAEILITVAMYNEGVNQMTATFGGI